MAEITTPAPSAARRLTADRLANVYALAAEKIRAQGLLSPSEPVRGQSARAR